MKRQSVIFLNSVTFVLGFTAVFSLLGVALQTLLAGYAFSLMGTLRLIGGAIIIIFGILLIAALKYRIPLFSADHKIKAKKFRNSYVTSFILGVAFAIGWTPCVGFILGSIYALAATSPGIGFILLLSYSLGIGVPFLLAGIFTSHVSVFLEKSQRILKYFNIIGGLLLVLIGLLVFFNYLGIIAAFFIEGGAVSAAGQLNIFVAFFAGIVTFLSPCILPLLPAFFSYMAGTTALEVKK